MANQPTPSFSFNLDFITFSFYLALVGIGGLFIYSVDVQQSGMPADLGSFLLGTQSGKQVVWIVICLLVFFFITSLLDHKFWQVFAYLIYGLGVVSLVLVLIFGTTIKGATSWFSFGGFSFQPSEIAKFGTCLGVAAMLNHWSTDLRKPQHVLRVILLFLAPGFLILLQPDAGSALVFFSFFIVLFREGLAPLLYVIGLIAAATLIISIIGEPLAIVTGLACVAMLSYAVYEEQRRSSWLLGLLLVSVGFWWGYQQGQAWLVLGLALLGVLFFSYRQYSHFRTRLIPIIGLGFVLTSSLAVGSNYFYREILKPHQQQRIDVWLRPEEAKKRNKDSVFNLEQSKLAIGAGGVVGQGFMSGRMTSGRFVPEQDTDFIFCTIGEEQGFLGSATVIILYLLLLLRIVQIAERQKTTFNRVYAYGVAGILFVHFAVNIGMTMGLMPIIGIPLPFLSKGGSSLLGFTIMIAVLLKLDRHRGRLKTVGGGVI
jgi:rod shape determining protein RodA